MSMSAGLRRTQPRKDLLLSSSGPRGRGFRGRSGEDPPNPVAERDEWRPDEGRRGVLGADVVFSEHRQLIDRHGRRWKKDLEEPRGGTDERDRDVNEQAAASQGPRNFFNNLIERENVRSADFHGLAGVGVIRCARETSGHVVDIDRLEPALPAAQNRHGRREADHIGKPDGEVVSPAVYERRPEDCPGEAGGPDPLLGLPLGLMIPGRGVGPRAESALEDEPADVLLPCGGEDVLRSPDVNCFERGPLRLLDNPDEVDNRVGALGGAGEGRRVGDVPDGRLRVRSQDAARLLRIADEGPDLFPVGLEPPDEEPMNPVAPVTRITAVSPRAIPLWGMIRPRRTGCNEPLLT